MVAVTAGVEIGHAGHHLEGAAEAAVDKPLAVQPLVQGRGLAKQQVAGHVAGDGQPQPVRPVFGGDALVARQELGHGDLHLPGRLLLGHLRRLLAVVPGDDGAALPGQDAPCQVHHVHRVHVAHHREDHVGGGVERLVAVVQRLSGDLPDGLDAARHGDAAGVVLIQGLHHPGIDLPVGVVLDHADLLADDALLLGNALLGKIGDGHEGQQNLQILLKMVGGVEVVAGHGVGGEGVGLRTVLRQFLKGVALLGVEHLVLQIVGDARRGVQPLAVQLEAHVHAAVAGGEEGVLLDIAGLGHHADHQAVGQGLPEDRLAYPLVKGLSHSAASFPFRK